MQTRVTGIISLAINYDQQRFRSTAVGQNAYPASGIEYLEYGIRGQWKRTLAVRYVEVVRHTGGAGRDRDMEITRFGGARG